MNILRLMICFFLALFPALPLMALAQSPPAKAGKRVALLVGVNKYEKRGFRDLEFAERDVTELADVLKKSGYEIHLLTGDGAGTNQATLENIQKSVLAALKGRTKHDLVLVGLAGHGLQLEIEENKTLRSESFYCPVDAVRSDKETLLSMGWLFDRIDAFGGGQNVVLVDACREDPARGRGLDGSKVQALPEGLAVLFGCRAGQKSYETKNAGGGHGVFFHFVLEGLRGGAANSRGDVTWAGLAEYVSEQVEAETPGLLELPDIQQVPNEVKNLGGKSPLLARLEGIPALPLPAEKGRLPIGEKAGQERDDNGIKMKFCWCPAGTFKMGSPDSDKDAEEDEQPQVEVTLSRGFWLGKHEVTQGEWERVMGTTPWKAESYVEDGADYAVSYVSWDDVVKFCETLSASERNAGRLSASEEYRLPTEAEWEYACRSGKTTRYSFGDDAGKLSEFAWWGGQVGEGNAKNEWYAHQVGLKKPNAWGLHDMHGNVWEWCSDLYGEKLPGGRDPSGFATGSNRVSRGGGWLNQAAYGRSAFRGRNSPVNRLHNLGLRVALSPSGKSPVLARIERVEPPIPPKPMPNKPGLVVGQKAGEEWDDNGIKMKFCWCPAGTFKMGSPASDRDAEEDEQPQVDVTLSRGFWLGKHEVTQGEWEAVMETTPWKGQNFVEEGADHAASYVDAHRAVWFCEGFSASERKAGRLSAAEEYRLPTEAEWEYACRSGKTTRYSFGDDASKLSEFAWWGGFSEDGNAANELYAHQVGQKKPNPWGFHDMHGNVWEWCSDTYGELPGGKDPKGSSSHPHSVLRGGGWSRSAGFCRSAARYRYSAGAQEGYLGFRVALSPSGK